MTTYKLPEVLGGGEVREADHSGDQSWPNHIVVAVFDSAAKVTWYVLVPRHALTEVPPPLPEEPAELGWYLAQIHGNKQPIRKVMADGWRVGRGEGLLSTWKTLNEDYPGITMVRLVPAPAPVELPWEVTDADGVECLLHSGGRRFAAVVTIEDSGIVGLSPDKAREMAAALITAADKAEAQDA